MKSVPKNSPVSSLVAELLSTSKFCCMGDEKSDSIGLAAGGELGGCLDEDGPSAACLLSSLDAYGSIR